ncbi:MAG: Na+/H+ antiporter subunit E [Burkholderiales bacterium]|nr:Na+/H+ antiporter subunit E [Burkholderiales bacterium]
MPRGIGTIARRSALLSVAWIILGRTGPVDLVVGIIVAVLVASVSLTLIPSAYRTVSINGIVRFALRFVARSLMAGVDVASRVLGTRVRVQPGILSMSCAVPNGVLRQFFSSLSSLQPGILPLGGSESAIRIHSLDIDVPVESEMAADAVAFMAMYRTRAQ